MYKVGLTFNTAIVCVQVRNREKYFFSKFKYREAEILQQTLLPTGPGPSFFILAHTAILGQFLSMWQKFSNYQEYYLELHLHTDRLIKSHDHKQRILCKQWENDVFKNLFSKFKHKDNFVVFENPILINKLLVM